MEAIQVKATGPPLVSIVVCTRDRPAHLRTLLKSICSLEVPPDLLWELLVIDNGTAGSEAVAEFAGCLPIRLVREPKAGLSHARNRGVEEALGEYMCWVDDDTAVDRGWLAGYVAAFRRHPDAAVFGGPILACLEEPVPAWVAASRDMPQLRAVFAERDCADAAPILANRYCTPWGANYAVRSLEQKRLRYDPNLGLSPDTNRSGEESDLLFRMLSGGACGWWVPDARVQHLIPQARLTKTYLHSYFVRAGETLGHLEARGSTGNCGRLGWRRWALAPLILALCILALRALYSAATLVRHSRLGVRTLSRAGFYEGLLIHLRQQATARTLHAGEASPSERASC